MYNLKAIAGILASIGAAPQFTMPAMLVPTWYLPLSLIKEALDLDLPETPFSRMLRVLDYKTADWLRSR
jgi:hypothetical protein